MPSVHLRSSSGAFRSVHMRVWDVAVPRGRWKERHRKTRQGGKKNLMENKSVKSYLAPAAVNLSLSVDGVGRDQQCKIGSLFQRTDHTLQLWGVRKKDRKKGNQGAFFLDSCIADVHSWGCKRRLRKCSHKIKVVFNRSNQCFYISRSTPCFHQAWSILLPCGRLISNCLCNVQMFKKHL